MFEKSKNGSVSGEKWERQRGGQDKKEREKKRKGQYGEKEKENMNELKDVGQRQVMLKSGKEYVHFILECNG